MVVNYSVFIEGLPVYSDHVLVVPKVVVVSEKCCLFLSFITPSLRNPTRSINGTIKIQIERITLIKSQQHMILESQL